MPRPTDEKRLRVRLTSALGGASGALLLALAAAHYYSAPNLDGSAHGSPWLEGDFCLALASSALALGVAFYAGRGIARTRVLSAVLGRVLLWFALTIALGVAWASSIALLTILVAPSHAFAGVQLGTLWRAWRSERQLRK